MSSFVILGGAIIYTLTNMLSDSDVGSSLWTLCIPSMIMLYMVYGGFVLYLIPTLIIQIIMILIGLWCVGSRVTRFVLWVVLGGMGLFVAGISAYMGLAMSGVTGYQSITIGYGEYITTLVVSFCLLIISYLIAYKREMTNLYPVSTLMHILIVLPIIHGTSASTTVSVIAICMTLVLSILYCRRFFVIGSAMWPYILGLSMVALFVGGEIYIYDQQENLGLVSGVLYIGLSVVYCIPALLTLRDYGLTTETKNMVYSYLGMTTAFLAVACAFIFGNAVGIVALCRVTIGCVLLYTYHHLQDDILYYGGCVLYAIGLVKMSLILDTLVQGAYTQLVPTILIGGVLVMGLYMLRTKTSSNRMLYDILHAGGLGLVAMMLHATIIQTGHGWSTLGVTSIVMVISGVYMLFYTGYTRQIMIAVLLGTSLWQYIAIDSVMRKLASDNVMYLKPLQYISTAFLAVAGYFQYRTSESIGSEHKIIVMVMMSLYLFASTTVYIDDIFNNTFAVSLYRGVLAYSLIHRGIARDAIKYRTIGLYIMSLTLIKVGCYDIRYRIDSGMMRVVALVLLGGLLIYLSTLYTRTYKTGLQGEFSPSNILQ